MAMALRRVDWDTETFGAWLQDTLHFVGACVAHGLWAETFGTCMPACLQRGRGGVAACTQASVRACHGCVQPAWLMYIGQPDVLHGLTHLACSFGTLPLAVTRCQIDIAGLR